MTSANDSGRPSRPWLALDDIDLPGTDPAVFGAHAVFLDGAKGLTAVDVDRGLYLLAAQQLSGLCKPPQAAAASPPLPPLLLRRKLDAGGWEGGANATLECYKLAINLLYMR